MNDLPRLKFHGNLLLRTPLLAQKDSLTEKELKDYLQQSDVSEAIFLASSYPGTQIQPYVNGKILKNKDKLVQTYYCYLIRMMNRPTPFGKFAGFSKAIWGKTTALNFGSSRNEKVSLHTRLLHRIVRQLEKEPAIRFKLQYYPNSSISWKKKRITYIFQQYRELDKLPVLNHAPLSKHLSHILKKTKEGITFAELMRCLAIFDKNLDKEEIISYLDEVINAQILMSELEPNITGGDYFDRIVSTIHRISCSNEAVRPIVDILKKVKTTLASLSGRSSKAYYQIFTELKTLAGDINMDKAFIAHVEKLSNASGLVLSKNIQQELVDCIQFLEKIYVSREDEALNEFLDKFYQRYGTQEVPILDALDPERGLGYPVGAGVVGNSFLKDISFLENAPSKKEIQWDSLTKKLFQLLDKYHSKEIDKIDLCKEIELRDFTTYNKKRLPSSLSVLFSLSGVKNGHAEIVFHFAGGSSGANLFSRFGSFDSEIARWLREVADYEQKQMGKDKILAEIIHVPDILSANLLARPALRTYEIPYLAKSNLPSENQIALNDLLVSVSLLENRIILKSKKFQKEVYPILSNVHNYKISAHPIYGFLTALQFQHFYDRVQFDWGSLKNLYQVFPRVYYKNIIISRATWYLNRTDFEKLNQLQELEIWKKKWELPDKFLLVERDNELLIDFKSKLSKEVFLKLIKNKKKLILKEFIFDPATCPVRDVQGKAYTNEFVGILLNEKKCKVSEKRLLFKQKSSKVIREFSPGSEWLYYKIYCGVEFADTLISDYIDTFVKKFQGLGVIDKWFFIRYSDPDFHLRFRFHFKDLSYLGVFLKELTGFLQNSLEEKLIWKIQTDSYQRELERYGFETIELAESFFYHDSLAVLKIIRMIRAERNDDIRWQFALLSTDCYLNDFGLSVQEKQDFAASMKSKLEKQFGLNNKPYQKTLNRKYRFHRSQINQLFESKYPTNNWLSPILQERQKNLGATMKKWLNYFETKNEKKRELGFDLVLPSLLHMHFNRLFKNQQPYNEFVIYYLLDKHYASFIARRKAFL